MSNSIPRWPRYRRSIGLTFFLVLLLVLARGSIADIAMDAGIQRIVTAELAPETAGRAGGLAVAVYASGRTRFFNYGFADGSTRRPITSDTLFNLASVRKLFEATLVALGTLRGEIDMDDPVSKYVPELRGDYIKRVTIGELATHTSGLLLPTDHPPWPNDSFTLSQFLDMLNAWTPQSGEQPGKQRIYSHAGYVLLQLALERRYGRPIGALIEERILKPLGMNQTLLPERGPDNRAILVPELSKRLVQGYGDSGTAIGPPGDQQSYFDFPGTGQMFSSARDLAIFLSASVGGMPIDPQLRQALQMTQRETFHVSEKFGQAMAWENVHLGEVDVVDKPGGLNNASAYVGLVPAHKIGIVLLANRADFPHEIARYRVLPELARERED
jgi:beta-lactamase class C